ncbi:MAG: cell division protein FtsK [Francisellaceae bacterium]|nr:cell division protein FtsK [Francisellaceae bacterium]
MLSLRLSIYLEREPMQKRQNNMKRKRKNRLRKEPNSIVSHILWRRIHEGAFILLIASSIFLFTALTTYSGSDPGWSHTSTHGKIINSAGLAGAYFSDMFFYLFGYLAYLFPVMIGYAGISIYQKRSELGLFHTPLWILRIFGFSLSVGAGSALAFLHFKLPSFNVPEGAGGILGSYICHYLVPVCNYLGTTLILLALFLSGITLTTGLSWLKLMDKTGRYSLILFSTLNELLEYLISFFIKQKFITQILNWMGSYKVFLAKVKMQEIKISKGINLADGKIKLAKDFSTPKMLNPPPVMPPKIKPKKIIDNKVVASTELPKVDLLEEAEVNTKPQQTLSKNRLDELSKIVELRLQEFGIEVQVVSVLPGPVITRFEMELAAGQKVSKILSLNKDLARALSVSRVRVVDVIPGKALVGLEIPNPVREIVKLREIIESEEYHDSHSPLSLALGKDIAGKPMVVNLAKMPHLLVAGTTGSGKSVGVNAMLLSLLYKSTVEEVRLILIDPKMLEFSVYEGIPHLLTPVVTDMKDAASALKWCVAEMERRYQLMAAMGVRNLLGFNQKVIEAKNKGQELLNPLKLKSEQNSEPLSQLPYIVVIIDEFADMMMVVGKKVEELIARIAQKARAAGIHMILATQRPSVDVITGLIKANIPTRIAFQVSSKIDSRTILDQQGAEQLLGHGDMLYLAPGTGIPTRIHGAFVSDDEVHKVVAALKKLGEPNYIEEIVEGGDKLGSEFGGGADSGEQDELYDQAVNIVIESRRASISNLQRRLKIGYNRAARLIDEMEISGVVSAMQSNGAREVISQALNQ